MTQGSTCKASEEKKEHWGRMNIRAVSQEHTNGVISSFSFSWLPTTKTLKWQCTGSLTSHSVPWSLCGLLCGSESGCSQSLRPVMWKSPFILAPNTIGLRPRDGCRFAHVFPSDPEWRALDPNCSLDSVITEHKNGFVVVVCLIILFPQAVHFSLMQIPLTGAPYLFLSYILIYLSLG